jgi:hypothetical protein
MSLEEFIRTYKDLQIVRLPDPARNARMIEIVRRLHAARVQFDPYFDPQDSTTVCCTELTALAIAQAGYPPVPVWERTANASLLSLMTTMNVTTPGLLMAGAIEQQPAAQTVATLSRYRNAAMNLAMRDASALLHERFAADPNARIGDWLQFNSSRFVHFHPRIELYLQAVEGLAAKQPSGDPARLRQRHLTLYDIIVAPQPMKEAADLPTVHELALNPTPR